MAARPYLTPPIPALGMGCPPAPFCGAEGQGYRIHIAVKSRTHAHSHKRQTDTVAPTNRQPRGQGEGCALG